MIYGLAIFNIFIFGITNNRPDSVKLVLSVYHVFY